MLPTTRCGTNGPFSVLREMDRALNTIWSDVEGRARSTSFPVDIHEFDDKLVIEADLPGFTKDQIEVNLEQGVLTIEANRTSEKTETKEGETHLHERRAHHLIRRFALPESFNTDAVDAKLADGVLSLTLPKREEVKPKKITVN